MTLPFPFPPHKAMPQKCGNKEAHPSEDKQRKPIYRKLLQQGVSPSLGFVEYHRQAGRGSGTP